MKTDKKIRELDRAVNSFYSRIHKLEEKASDLGVGLGILYVLGILSLGLYLGTLI